MPAYDLQTLNQNSVNFKQNSKNMLYNIYVHSIHLCFSLQNINLVMHPIEYKVPKYHVSHN